MGLEPTLDGSTNRCFNQLSYDPNTASTGIEPVITP